MRRQRRMTHRGGDIAKAWCQAHVREPTDESAGGIEPAVQLEAEHRAAAVPEEARRKPLLRISVQAGVVHRAHAGIRAEPGHQCLGVGAAALDTQRRGAQAA